MIKLSFAFESFAFHNFFPVASGGSGSASSGGGRIKGRPPMTKASSFGGTVTLLCRGDSLDISPTAIKGGKLGEIDILIYKFS